VANENGPMINEPKMMWHIEATITTIVITTKNSNNNNQKMKMKSIEIFSHVLWHAARATCFFIETKIHLDLLLEN